MHKIFIFLPTFENMEGHEGTFIKPLHAFGNQLKFSKLFIVPKKNKSDTSQNFIKILNSRSKVNFFLGRFIFNFYNILINFLKIKKQLKDIKKKDIVYLDGMCFFFKISFIFALLFKPKTNLLIMWLRFGFDDFLRRNLIKFFIFLNDKIFFSRIIFLTDNNILSEFLSKKYKIQCDFMPSIHQINYKKKKYVKKINPSKKLKILCPGTFRYEKYGKNLISFLDKNRNCNYTLYINKNFKKTYSNKKNINIKFFGGALTRRLYERLFNLSDLVFLPYDSNLYKHRYSGIMLEAINYLKFAFVSSGTPMSNELIKFGLKNFVIDDWSELNCQKILNAINNEANKKNFYRLHKYHLKTHNLKNWIFKLNNILFNYGYKKVTG